MSELAVITLIQSNITTTLRLVNSKCGRFIVSELKPSSAKVLLPALQLHCSKKYRFLHIATVHVEEMF